MQTSNRFAEYDFNAAFPEESDSSLLPRPDGGGVREADGGGLPTPPDPSPLTNDLLEDLLNPSISSLDLCAIHKLSLPALADLLESDQFKLAQSCMQRINSSRTDFVQPEAEAIALVRTHDILKDKPTTPAHAETQRKAASSLRPSTGGTGVSPVHSETGAASQRPSTSSKAASPAPAGEVDRRSRNEGGSSATLRTPTTPPNSLVTHTNKMLHSHHTFPHASPERAITMSHRKNKSINAIIAATVGAAASLSSAQNLFTYQGTLNDNGAPADGTYDFRFTLWDDQTIGAPDTQLGFTNPRSGVPVENGVFSVQLDMGTTDFSTAAGRYLQIEVRPSGGGGPYTTLNPRTPIDFAPRSIFSLGAEVAERLTLPYIQNGFPASSNSGIFNITNIDTSGYAIGADGPTWGLVGFGGDYSSFPPIQTPAGVFGIGERVGAGGSSDTGSGIYGITSTGNGGEFTVLSTNSGNALRARTAGSGHAGLFERTASTGSTAALRVTNDSTSFSAYGVHSTITSTSPGGNSTALRGENRGEGFLGIGVWGSHNGSGWGIYGTSGSGGLAGNFAGNVFVSGSLSKGSGTFKIDHPLDPANMYLSHSFVESPDMKNIYDGVVTLNKDGTATVTMPSYFDALNTEFRYQLTCIGGYAPVYIAEEISERQFSIAGGSPGLKVSWQITGIRQDPFAQANPVIVEEQKSAHEQGRYLHPELYDQPEDKGIYYVDPDTQQQN